MQRASAGVDVTFLGHSSVLLEFDPPADAPASSPRGPRLLTDPVLRGRVGPLRWHGDPAGARHAPVDGVLISHAHHDHLDVPSLDRLRRAGEQPRLVVPAGVGPFLRKRGFLRVQEVLPGDRLRLGDAYIRVVRADHDGMRRPFGPRAAAVGYLVESGVSVYFAGDTALFPEMSDMSRRLDLLGGGVDLALLPVWGWGPALGPGHLDPAAAAEAAARVQAGVAIPIHWGTLYPFGLRRVWPGRLRDPGLDFARRVAARDLPTEVRVLRPGASTRVTTADVPGLERVAAV